MNLYISVFTTSMLIIGAALCAGKLDSKSRDRQAYEEGVDLCKRSGCKDCGMFNRNSMNRVTYNPSFCEELFLRVEAHDKAMKLDAEIRAKFKDGGQ